MNIQKIVEISTRIRAISSLKAIALEGDAMKYVICPICGDHCIKYGKNRSGSQRWFCNACRTIVTPKVDNSARQLQIFLDWLFSRGAQSDLPGGGQALQKHCGKRYDLFGKKRRELSPQNFIDLFRSDYCKHDFASLFSTRHPGAGDLLSLKFPCGFIVSSERMISHSGNGIKWEDAGVYRRYFLRTERPFMVYW